MKKASAIEAFKDVNNNVSSKRIVTFICVFMMVVGFFADLFLEKEVPESMYSSIMFIVIVGLGFAGAEHFSGSNKFNKITSFWGRTTEYDFDGFDTPSMGDELPEMFDDLEGEDFDTR